MKRPSTKKLIETYAKLIRNVNAPLRVHQRLHDAWMRELRSEKFAKYDTTSEEFKNWLQHEAEKVNAAKMFTGAGSDY